MFPLICLLVYNSVGEISSMELPTGTVTFLFTDIEGSTRLWEEQPEAMQIALARHDEILLAAVTQHGGFQVKTTGDGLHAVFRSAQEGALAAIAGQQGLAAEKWDPGIGQIKVRMALHSGTAEVRAGDYYGPAVNRAARLLAAAHGQQILLSQATASLLDQDLPAGAKLLNMGRHRLKDLAQPEQISQLTVPGQPADFPPLNTRGPLRAELPSQVTQFIGREEELAAVKALLAQDGVRLVTLTGPGGTGKTRLATETARQLQGAYADGVVFVPLAPVAEARRIPDAIAQSLHLTLAGPPAEQVMAYLRNRQMLLVLDNCEQLGEGLEWLSELLAQAPGIELLTTSRERLQLAEEWVYPVPALAETQSVALFTQAAQRARPDFETNRQEEVVRAICRLVEHLPLAVELAAGWVSFMSCAQIAEQIRGDIDFLTTNLRNVPERHRSLRAVFDHSWRLLAPAEQEVLMRLSVFRGGWTFEEVGPVAAPDGGAKFLHLRALVEKSLVQVTDEGRYDLHELTRHYAAEKLTRVGKEDDGRQRHAQTYLALVTRAEPELYGPEAIAWFARLDREQDNLRAALTWLLEKGQVEMALEMVNVLYYFWFRRGYWQEGERWTAAAIALAGDQDSPSLCRALVYLAGFIAVQGRYSESAPYMARAYPMAYRLEDPRTLATTLWTYSQAVGNTAGAEKGTEAIEEALSILKDEEAWWAKTLTAYFYGIYGDLQREVGRYEEAASHYQKSLELMRQIGNVDMIAYPIGNLGRLALQDGRLDEAYQMIAESVAISRAIGNRVGMADWLYKLGEIALYRGDLVEAEACLQEALTLYREMNNQRGQPDVQACLAHVALLRGEVGVAARYLDDCFEGYQLIYRQQKASEGILPGSKVRVPPEFVEVMVRAGLVALKQEDDQRAITFFSIAENFCEHTGRVPVPPLQASIVKALVEVRTQLTDKIFAEAWIKGQGMSLEEALAFGREA